MKILAVFRGSFPNGGPMSKRLHLYCKGLIEQENEVKIIIPHATEPFGKRSINNIVKAAYDTVPYEYLTETNQRSKFFLKRRIDDFIGYVKLFIYLLKNHNKADVLLIVDVRNLMLVFLFIISRMTGSKLVYELNEHPIIITSKFRFLINRLFTYRLFDGFIVISKPLSDLVLKFNKRISQILIVPIIAEKKNIINIDNPKIDITEPYILHTGSLIERKDGIIGMIEALGIVIKEFNITIKFYFSGKLTNSPDYDKIQETIDRNKLNEQICFLGYLTEEELVYYQSNCSLVIINKADNLQNKFCFPTKLGEYLSFAIPVIITKVGVANELFYNNINAYVVEPNNPTALAEKIVDILQFPNKSKMIGLKGQELANAAFDYKKQTIEISNFFNRLQSY